MTATSGKPIRQAPAVVLPPAMAALQRWRNADHEDSIYLSRDDVVTLVEEMRQQLADAQAAQALVVERAAEAGQEIADAAHANAMTEKPWSKARNDMMKRCWGAEDAVRAIRAIADPTGVAALVALRADHEAVKTARDMMGELWANEKSRADALAAKLAAAEARVGALTEAVREARDAAHSMAHDQYDGVWNEQDFREYTPLSDAALTTPAEETKG